MRVARAAAAIVLFVGGVGAAPMPTGLFSNVWYHEDSGDLIGLEVAIRRAESGLVADVAVCEGGCYGGKALPLRPVSGGMEASYVERQRNSDGRIMTSRSVFRLSAQGRGVSLAARGDIMFPAEHLKPAKQRWGLRVAFNEPR